MTKCGPSDANFSNLQRHARNLDFYVKFYDFFKMLAIYLQCKVESKEEKKVSQLPHRRSQTRMLFRTSAVLEGL